jgi:endogenous inhibitor of DNA gyrase (YacG/DUF329 family)
MRCPTCHVEFAVETSRSMPFCSPRCKQIDLKRWLGEEISLPYGEASDEDPRSRDSADSDHDD